MEVKSLHLICVVQVVHSFIFQPEQQQRPNVSIVTTQCGQVMGLHNGNGYSYKSIPYARPPTGSRRWQPPEPLSRSDGTCWSGLYNATEFVSQCVQWNDDATDVVGTEDCLHLNVWSPTVGPTANLPVMVFVHGGNLEYGNSHDSTYSPTEELARDTQVVYVSMNYRLHAFGFMALDILTQNSKTNTSGNYGFMDQILALKWVQDNIGNFGGDPKQVTLFGQSGGATAVIALVTSPLSKNLFSKAWILSGSPIFTTSLAQASRDNLSFLNNTGCTNITCLQQLSPLEVTKAVEWDSFPNWNENDQYILPKRGDHDGSLPVIDGYVMPESPQDAWLHGKANDVPLLIGTMAQELDDVAPGNGTWADYEALVREYLGTYSNDIADMALHLYPVGEVNPRYQLACMITDIRVGCGNDVMALYASANKAPVYRYVGVHQPSSPISGYVYSFHTWDVYAFFGAIKDLLDHPTATDYMFEANIRQEVMSFVHDGRPHTSTWQPFPRNIGLLSDTTSVVNSYHSYQCSFWMMQGFYRSSWAN
ncbi:para-nitrobenzyl esterase-like [Ylistrum balloti]|uniref:para-nitrobenzyl esterase-like n=1 Tax=Ylistrum balloti TaxID=509963 RepID=UPI002905DCBE|nr:para-nitrobenzyl esterase-like [Ylistrum balloti]